MILKIKKDKHKSFRFPRFFWKWKEIVFNVTMDKSCLYDERELEHTGVNKLFGVALSNHNEAILKYCPRFLLKFVNRFTNSYRIGWKSSIEKNYFVLYHYSCSNGVEKITKMINRSGYEVRFYPDIQYEVKIINHLKRHKRLEIQIKEKSYFIPLNQSPIKLSILLFFYFGGRSKAPHNMQINLKYQIIK